MSVGVQDHPWPALLGQMGCPNPPSTSVPEPAAPVAPAAPAAPVVPAVPPLPVPPPPPREPDRHAATKPATKSRTNIPDTMEGLGRMGTPSLVPSLSWPHANSPVASCLRNGSTRQQHFALVALSSHLAA